MNLCIRLSFVSGYHQHPSCASIDSYSFVLNYIAKRRVTSYSILFPVKKGICARSLRPLPILQRSSTLSYSYCCSCEPETFYTLSHRHCQAEVQSKLHFFNPSNFALQYICITDTRSKQTRRNCPKDHTRTHGSIQQ